ncbi:hypothetical protein AHMF7605_20360 [Adhaeribacter arboris]|uniref:tRNA (Guanine-N1)-methyltransferase n=1 Tax=Adhaeribacter arboris TaxID=2072846 RepID=A0A2T2YJL3_9BACT|nr:hypothetical protein [Adhaeribacter arboris]PSR55689.1 hypothetical protein AHMF7605_20360 [Adhaeribacter arboris]
MKVIALFIATIFMLITGVRAQQPAPVKPTYNALQNQFNALKSRSTSYKEYNQDFKVVQVKRLDAFWKNVQDSLRARESTVRKAGKATEQALKKTQQELAQHKAELQSLKQANLRKEQQIQQNAHEVASLSVFGLDMDKQLYVILSWVIIIGLLVMALVFSYLYKKSKIITDEKIKAFEEVSQEFTVHKQSARERELKIKRDLQTESNRVAELNQEITLLKKQVSM